MTVFQIACGVNGPAQCQVTLPYSPWIINLRRDTKFQIWRQDSDDKEPELEFDGVVIAKGESKDAGGGATFSFAGASDCIVWKRRKRYDLNLMNLDIFNTLGVGSGAEKYMLSPVSDYLTQTVKASGFDAGVAFSSIGTSDLYYEIEGDSEKTPKLSGYQFYYNGQVFEHMVDGSKGNQRQYAFGDNLPSTHWWYYRYLVNYGLARKVYGVPCFTFHQTYSKAKEFSDWISGVAMMGGGMQSFTEFMQLGVSILNYMYYESFCIPRATFIKRTNQAENGDIEKFTQKTIDNDDEYNTVVTKMRERLLNDKTQYNGIAEFILMPQSVFKIPPFCNVIFPRQIVSMSMNQDFLSEITRNTYSPKIFPGFPFGKTYVGPNKVSDKDGGYFESFGGDVFDMGYALENFKNDLDVSPYEKEYGINHIEISFNTAYNMLMNNLSENERGKSDREVKALDALRKRASDTEDKAKQKELVLNMVKQGFADYATPSNTLLPSKTSEAEEALKKASNDVIDSRSAASKATADLSKALEEAKEKERETEAKTILRRLVNYEFVKKRLESRSFSIQVDSTVDAVPGHGMLILSDSGAHIMALCRGYSKTWSANGQYTITLHVGYPRYYHEDITNVGITHDFILGGYEEADQENAEKTLEKTMDLIGSGKIMNIKDFKNHRSQMANIEGIYLSEGAIDQTRSVTTFGNFVVFHGGTLPDKRFSSLNDYKDIAISTLKDRSIEHSVKAVGPRQRQYAPINDLLTLMDSSVNADSLSTSVFRIKGVDITNMKNSDIIKEHNKAIEFAQRL